MLRTLDAFVWTLRREGFAVSTAQAIDVARVVRLVGFTEKRALRAAIAAVVVTRREDRSRFAETFERFFAKGGDPGDLWSRLRSRGFAETELEALRELLEAAAQMGGDGRSFAALVGRDGELDQLLRAASIAKGLAVMTSPLQAGFFAHQVMNQLEVPKATHALARLRSGLRQALGEERGAALSAALEQELDQLRQRVREHVDRVLRQRLGEDRPRGPGLADMPFVALGERQLAEVRRAVRTLAERFRGGERVRRRRARAGAIDPHRTLRRSLATGGVPFVPARRARRRDKPRLIVLCDVSDSVRTASLFMLEFVHAVQELFGGTRSFVFVNEILEVTDLFASLSAEAALARIYRGGVVNLTNKSDYGHVMRSFEAEIGRSVDRRTTVVILGDGRTNYLADEAEVVARLRHRARALLWLCPEKPDTWSSGDSAMVRYSAAATKVLVAHTARELEVLAREVVARRK